MQLVGLQDDGSPKYYETNNNTDAAKTISTDKLHNNGGQNLNLEGQNMTIGEWDGGGTRIKHREFGSRVTQRDNVTGTSSHATHVAGTMVASGITARAKGMAPQAKLWAHDWFSDAAEMANAASAGLLISNHSYGTGAGWSSSNGTWSWLGSVNISTVEDYKFGFYDSRTREWDKMARLAPYYLIVKSAGNDRNDNHSGSHRARNSSGSWTTTSAARNPDGQFDCISTYGTAKNILTVGAVNDLTSGYTNAGAVRITGFSSYGPTDDGRIKPDIVGNGAGLYSCNNTGNSAYYSSSGTSMSSPSVAASCLLLQQHHNNKKARYMRSSSLKALVIHTADEAGTWVGPDYSFGWGLMNSLKAVKLIDDTAVQFDELKLNNGQNYERYVFSTGNNPVRVTVCWTDIEGIANSPSLNPATIKLVNDLDVRLVNTNTGVSYSPYRLNPLVPTSAATKGDNFRDNVEQIYYSSLPVGGYVLRVSHKGSLSTGSQNFSIIAEGLVDGPRADFTVSSNRICIGDTVFLTNTSSGNISNYNWTFIGATTSGSTAKNSMAIFDSPGNFTIQLRATSGNLSDTKTVNITVGNVDDAGVLESDTAFCTSENQFVVLSPISPNGRWKDIGSWMPSIDSCRFLPRSLAEGDYEAIHTITNGLGCVSSDTITVKIRENPIVTLLFNKTEYCNTDTAAVLTEGTPSGGLYYINDSLKSIFDPSVESFGRVKVEYFYTDTNGCEGFERAFVQLNECEEDGVSVKNYNEEDRVTIYPNPFRNKLSVNNLTGNSMVLVSDALGRMVDFSSELVGNKIEIDLSNAPSGVYQISVEEEGQSPVITRVIKQ